MLAEVSDVVFEPRTDGAVQEFVIADGGQERRLADGAAVAKDVTLNAKVLTPDGQVVSRTLVVTMRRGPGQRSWFITAVTPLRASQTSPAASSDPPS